MGRFPVPVTGVAVMAAFSGAALLTACAAKDDNFVCPAIAEEGPQVLYPENGARNVPVSVGEVIYFGSTDGGSFFLQSSAGAVSTLPRGIAPTPYPSPIATPMGLPSGPHYFVSFGRLAPATTYTVKLGQPANTGPCDVGVAFMQTTFTTK